MQSARVCNARNHPMFVFRWLCALCEMNLSAVLPSALAAMAGFAARQNQETVLSTTFIYIRLDRVANFYFVDDVHPDVNLVRKSPYYAFRIRCRRAA